MKQKKFGAVGKRYPKWCTLKSPYDVKVPALVGTVGIDKFKGWLHVTIFQDSLLPGEWNKLVPDGMNKDSLAIEFLVDGKDESIEFWDIEPTQQSAVKEYSIKDVLNDPDFYKKRFREYILNYNHDVLPIHIEQSVDGFGEVYSYLVVGEQSATDYFSIPGGGRYI